MNESENDSRLQQWGALAGGLAHEIKNPLSTMNISLQLLREDLMGRPSISSAQILPRVDLLISEVGHLQKILADFLRLARAPELSPQVKDPNAILEETLAFLKPELNEHRIGIVTQLDREHSQLLFDPNLIRQALVNLFKNALEAMPNGGTLTVQSRWTDDHFQVDIIDTGDGIAEDIRSRIFDGFFSTKPGGTGIGLSLTRQIVERHAGSIVCASAVGKGSYFSVKLPRQTTSRSGS